MLGGGFFSNLKKNRVDSYSRLCGSKELYPLQDHRSRQKVLLRGRPGYYEWKVRRSKGLGRERSRGRRFWRGRKEGGRETEEEGRGGKRERGGGGRERDRGRGRGKGRERGGGWEGGEGGGGWEGGREGERERERERERSCYIVHCL